MVFQSISEIGDLVPGKRLADRFEIVKANRQGGLSVAFEVLDLASQEPREMQFFPSSLFDGEREAREFASSWEPWRRVDSPHVQALREVLPLGSSSLFLIHDLPAGVCLRDRVGKGERVEAGEVVDLGLQLLDGLGEIHGHGLVHGDVKPTTVFVQALEGGKSGWSAQLVDGGTTHGLWTAKDLGERTALIGTPYYAPVEQFGGDPPTVQSDLYNVATLLFELVSGAQPWAGKSFLEVFQAKLERKPPSIASRAPGIEVDPALEAAIAGGLYADLDSRYASAREFRDRLAACAR
ncbi:serine/threonine protein kinase [Engelhardtia mirabilis]|uniref:Serine/threonine-protein kinase pkn5 n=1 Tax=Engelhardtia mirabilis TaxID=2528011 RepID=A0A518BHM9_9BACT|nr:Serine/threonine-protein kinase pkn5 [Planctomycetes bacterium Pla133]QDV00813.1 Serine/threonine-protein kinase pkn5 [Planctomycetes bacterium Pla86]